MQILADRLQGGSDDPDDDDTAAAAAAAAAVADRRRRGSGSNEGPLCLLVPSLTRTARGLSEADVTLPPLSLGPRGRCRWVRRWAWPGPSPRVP